MWIELKNGELIDLSAYHRIGIFEKALWCYHFVGSIKAAYDVYDYESDKDLREDFDKIKRLLFPVAANGGLDEKAPAPTKFK